MSEKANEKRLTILKVILNLSDDEILRGGNFHYDLVGKPGIVTFGNGLPPGEPPPPPDDD